MKNNYHERKAARLEKFRALAAKNVARSEQQFKRASEMARAIPFGQPILVGHHSEGRDRSYRKRIERLNDQGLESLRKAKYYERKAESAENNTAISSDDPDAIDRLKEKLAEMEKLQGFMKAVNRVVRKKGLSGEEKVALLVAMKVDEHTARMAIEPDRFNRVGFARYQLQNNNHNIARVRKRIQELKARAARQTGEEVVNGVRIVTNTEANRIQLRFPDKPDDTIRKELKRHGFRWSPREGVWQRHISNMALYYAREISSAYRNEPEKGE